MSSYNKQQFYINRNKIVSRHAVKYKKKKKQKKQKKNVESAKIEYKIVKNNDNDIFLNNKLWAHLHCHNIDKFDEIYNKYIDRIQKHFSIIVTYNIGNNIPDLDIIVLKVENRGSDIGPKFTMINYINNNNIKFDFVLMLHSKSHYQTRKKYFDKMLLNLDNIVSKLDNNNDGIYTFNIIHDGRIDTKTKLKYKKPWGRNNYHMKHILKTYQLQNVNYKFPEGNIYILHSTIANYIFDNRYDIYKQLNTNFSFDYSWFTNYYKLYNLSYLEAYKLFKTKNLKGNNFYSKNNDLGDAMIEHTFERIQFTVCDFFNKTKQIIK
jgi:hypothetical protein